MKEFLAAPMIDVKEAVQIAKVKAAEMLDSSSSNLEEIERESYKDRDAWAITLSLPRDLDQLPPIARLGADPLLNTDVQLFILKSNTTNYKAVSEAFSVGGSGKEAKLSRFRNSIAFSTSSSTTDQFNCPAKFTISELFAADPRCANR